MKVVFALTKIFYVVMCLFLFCTYAYSINKYGLGEGEFFYANIVIIVSSLLGLASVLLRAKPSRIAIMLSTIMLGALSAFAFWRLIMVRVSSMNEYEGVYDGGWLGLLLPIFIFAICIANFVIVLFKK